MGVTEVVHQKLLAERGRGAAILYISTELEEVIAISDRIAVMYKGKFMDILDPEKITVEEIGLLMGGGKSTLSIRNRNILPILLIEGE